MLAVSLVGWATIHFGGNAYFPIDESGKSLYKMTSKRRDTLEETWKVDDAKFAAFQEKEKTTNKDEDAIQWLLAYNDHRNAGRYLAAFEAIDKFMQSKESFEVKFHLLHADAAFLAGKFKASIKAFDEVIALEPSFAPSLWQRGIALYYDKRFEDGVKQFETHQKVNSQDVENSVWHMLCKVAHTKDLKAARESMIDIQHDSRVPMHDIFEMFAGNQSAEDVIKAGEATSGNVPAGSDNHKLQQYYAHLYVGLYQEMTGQTEASLQSIETAVKICPLPKTNFMGAVARVHFDARKPKKK